MINRRLRAEPTATLVLLGFIAIAAACPTASKAQATATQAQTPTASKAQTPTASPAQTSAASKAQTTTTASPQTGVTPLQLNPCLAQCVSLKQQVPQMTEQLASLYKQIVYWKQVYEKCVETGSACDPQADLSTINSLNQQYETLTGQRNAFQQVLTFLGCGQ